MKAPIPLKVNRMLPIAACVLAAFLIISCKNTKAPLETKSESLEMLVKLAKEKLGDDATTDFNKSQSHALVASVTGSTKTAKSIRFFVFDVNTSEIILEDFVSQGSVQWMSDNQIKVNQIPGKPGPQASRGYLFNIETKKKDQLPL